MAAITARIRIAHQEGADLLYFSDTEVLDALGIEHDQEFQNHRAIKEGTILNINGQNYTVVGMFTYFIDEANENNGKYGVSMSGAGERHPYNLQVTYYVTQV